MKNSIFVGRKTGLELFGLLRTRDPQEQWPLPILSFVGLPGSGKTTLIEELLNRFCVQDGHPILPYAYIDFTTDGAPVDTFPILVHLRDQLWQHEDANKKRLIFPRFDLIAVFASSIRTDASQPLSGEETQRRVKDFISMFGPLGEVSNALGNALNFIPPVWLFLRWAEQGFLQGFVQDLKSGSTWDWCRAKFQLPENTPIRALLQRMSDINKPNTMGRKALTELLSSAFFDDLHDALCSSVPLAWSKTTNAVIFLDGIEMLLDNPRNPGLRLLETLGLSEYRRRGEADPLLVVVGSQQRLFEPTGLPPILSQHGEDARQSYMHWYHSLPGEKQYLRLEDLSLEYTLPDLSLADVEEYIALFQQRQARLLAEAKLNATTIYRITHGHPLSISSVVTTVAEASARGRPITTSSLKQAAVEALSLSEFFSRLPMVEQYALILCATPRILDIDVLQVILQPQYDIEAQSRWHRYRRLAIFQALDEERLALHPMIRAFLLQRLSVRGAIESNYYKVHDHLRVFFHERAVQGDEQAHLEEIYHALALGDPTPAIAFAAATQKDTTLSWESLIEVVSQAPTSLMDRKVIEQRAGASLEASREQQNLQNGVTAIVLYTWLLSAAYDEPLEKAKFYRLLGTAYMLFARSALDEQSRHRSLQQAMSEYKAALEIYTPELAPSEYADTNFDLGETYMSLLGREEPADAVYLEAAEEHYLEAFERYNRERRDSEAKKAKEKLRTISHLQTRHVPPPSDVQLAPLVEAEEPQAAGIGATPVSPVSSLRSTLDAALPPGGMRVKARPALLTGITVLLLILLLTTSYTFLLPLFQGKKTPLGSGATPTLAVLPLPSGIGVVKIANGESIGINDGSYPPFGSGTGRVDNDLTQQAAQRLKEGNVAQAIAFWGSALEKDTNDAEARIYLEDQRVLASGHPYFTLIVGSAFRQPYPDVETLNSLQGAYVAQKEFNDGPGMVKVRLLIANSGKEQGYTSQVAGQIVALAQHDKTVVGVLGWMSSARSLSVIPVLAKAGIPMVSQTASSDALINYSAYFFRVVPPNKAQGLAAARFAEARLQAKRAVLFVDPSDSYSQSLVQDFTQQFTQDGNTILRRETFTTDTATNYSNLINDALRYNPDVLYFSGANDNDTKAFLQALPTSGPFAHLPAIGGDAGYVVVPNTYGRWFFTSFAHPDEWSFEKFGKQQPAFFNEYANDFDPNRQHPGYGYTRPNATAILTYDAAVVLLHGCQMVLVNGKMALSPQELAQALPRISGSQAIQGVSGQIAFGPDHDPVKKAIVVLRVDSAGFTQIISVQGCFLRTCSP